jgi:hypothetical protein
MSRVCLLLGTLSSGRAISRNPTARDVAAKQALDTDEIVVNNRTFPRPLTNDLR